MSSEVNVVLGEDQSIAIQTEFAEARQTKIHCLLAHVAQKPTMPPTNTQFLPLNFIIWNCLMGW